MRILLALALCFAAATAQAGEVGPAALAHLKSLAPIRGLALADTAIRGRIVAVVFFASWCPPCEPEFRYLKAAHARFRDSDLRIVAVNVFEDITKDAHSRRLKRFLERHAPPFPILKGTAETHRLFNALDRIPSLFVFDRKGAVAFHFRHASNAEKTHVGKNELMAVQAPLIAAKGS